MTTAARGNSHQIAIGLCILLLGVLLVLDRLGIVGADQTLRYWPVGLIIIGASVMLQAFRHTEPAKGSVPWGAIVWLLILGFALSHVFDRRAAATHADDERNISLFALIGGEKRQAGANVRLADITAVMGGAQLDLRGVQPKPGEDVVVDVFNLMGGSVIYVPPDWTVDTRAVAIMGGIADQRRRGRRISVDISPASPRSEQDVEASDAERPATPPRLVIRGYVAMGGLAIKSM